MIWGVGGTLAIMTIWDLFEVHTNIPRNGLPAELPGFLLITAIAKTTLFRRKPPGEE